jgi:hypothetical protein
MNTKHPNGLPVAHPIAHSIPAAVKASGLSRTWLYGAMQRGELAFVQMGGRRLILDDDLRALLMRNRVSDGEQTG